MAGGVCKFFIQGKCTFGDRCKYRHPGAREGSGGGGFRDNVGSQGGLNTSRAVCQHYSRGACTFGDRCKFEHPNHSRTGHTQYEQQQTGGNVCKHYLSGTCRFGDRCRYEHPSSGWSTGGRMQGYYKPPDHAYSSTRNPKGGVRFQFSQQDDWADGGHDGDLDLGVGTIQGGSIFGEKKDSSNTSLMPSTPQEAVQLIRGDMLEWKVSHMWPLSCYGFAGRCLPELKDISPEELRWEAYLGRHAGTVQAYVQAERALLDAQKSVQSRYEDISAGDAAMLLQTVQSHNPFAGATPTPSLFTSSAALNTLYGNAPLAGGGLQLGSHVPSPSLFGTGDQLTSTAAPGLVLGLPPASSVQVVGGDSGTKPSTEQCTQEELAMYSSDKFILGQIPEHAPPQSVC